MPDNLDVLASSSAGITPSTGRKTFGQVKTDVAMNFGVDQDPERVSLIGRMIHLVIDDLNRKKLWQFNLVKAADITTVANTTAYSVPADLWRLYSARKADSSDYRLVHMEEDQKDIIFQAQLNITGQPFVYTNFNIFRDGNIILFPAPDSAYTITLRYFRLIGKPASDGEYFDVPPSFQSVIEYGANVKMAAFTESDTLGFWKGEFEQAYHEMKEMDEDPGDEVLRFVHANEIDRYSFVSPAARGKFLDIY